MPKKADARTVRRWLRQNGIFSCWAARKPLLTSRHIAQRLQWATAMQGHDFSNTVWSDEKLWKIRSNAGRVRVWRRKGENRFEAKYTIKTTGQSVGVMVWAAITPCGKLMWKRCPERYDSGGYQEVLTAALPFIRSRCSKILCLIACPESLKRRWSLCKMVQACTHQPAPKLG